MESLINYLSATKKEFETLQPEDRMSLFVAVTRAVDAVAMSTGGWRQLLSDTTTLEKFDEHTLRSFFDHFREQAIRQLEFDASVLTKYADIIGARLPLQPAQRPRVAYG
jgi:superfamily I DNA/RNA helicase